jgi:hypothetical protein
MGVRLQRRFAHLPHELAERHLARHMTAQDEGVDEETDQVFGCRMRSTCRGGADQNIFLTGVAEEQRLERGQQRHERGDPFRVTHGVNLPGQLPWDL